MTTGILAVWNDCAEGQSELYEHWYQTEHLPERLSVPGIRRGRRYASLGLAPEFFTYYEVTQPGVLTGQDYLDKINNPTPLTRQIMSGIFLNMSRTVCTVARRRGVLRGAFAVTCLVPPQDLDASFEAVASVPSIARIEAWCADPEANRTESTEQRLRGTDQSINACLFVETLREAPARALARQLAPFGQTGIYALLCELTESG